MTEVLSFALGVVLALVLVTRDASVSQVSKAVNACVSNNGLKKINIEFGGVTNITCNNDAVFRQERDKQ